LFVIFLLKMQQKKQQVAWTEYVKYALKTRLIQLYWNVGTVCCAFRALER